MKKKIIGIFLCTLLIGISILPGISGGGEILEVQVDIKPGDYPNNINPNSNGNIPVAILTNESFDASIVDPDTVVFLNASPVKSKLKDVDKDGDDDMLFKFKTRELNFSLLVDEGDEYPYAYLTGETILEDYIQGKDTMRLVGTKQMGIFDRMVQRLIERFPLI